MTASDEASGTSAKRLASARAYKIANRAAILAWQKSYNAGIQADPKRRAKKLQQDRDSRKRHYDKRLAYDLARDKQKVRARLMVRHRIASGSIVRQPCEKCGKPKAHAHHDDYSKPLSIRWLCQLHHMEVHRER